MMRRPLRLPCDGLLPRTRGDQKVCYRLVSTPARHDQRRSPRLSPTHFHQKPDILPRVFSELRFIFPTESTIYRLASPKPRSRPATVSVGQVLNRSHLLPERLPMTTDKRRTANKRNAQNSTGPTSTEGKAASRMNALKTGLYAKSLVIPGESREEFDELVQQFNQQYRPVTPQARVLVDMVIRNTWLLRRFDRIEGEEWTLRLTRLEKHLLRPDGITSQAYELSCEFTDRIRKLSDSAERAIVRALNKLDRLTEHCPAPEAAEELPAADAEPASQSVAPEATSPEIGFVPPVSPENAPATRRRTILDDGAPCAYPDLFTKVA